MKERHSIRGLVLCRRVLDHHDMIRARIADVLVALVALAVLVVLVLLQA
jgi:hypothetical protein